MAQYSPNFIWLHKSVGKTLILLMSPIMLLGQAVNVNYSADYYHLIERYEILNGKISDTILGINKPFNRQQIANFAEKTDSITKDKSAADIYNIQYLKNDSWEWLSPHAKAGSLSKKKLFNTFFEHKSDAYSKASDDYDIHISPVFYFQAGRGADSSFWQNTRGIELRGNISKKLGFYTQLTENQTVLPQYQYEYFSQNNVVPGEGHYKPYGTRGYDYISARGYINFQILKPMSLTFGHDKSFVGMGYRSMILSDFAPPVLFFRINTQIGKVQYINQYSQLSNYQEHKNVFNMIVPKKYLVSHQLNFKISKNTELGFIENVVFARETDLDLNYLNPIIFYRFVESFLGSPDNAMAAFQFRHLTKKRISVYGQFLFDELIKSRLIANSENFANKWSYQFGAKAINVFGLKNFDYQFEFNKIRPYTYSHLSSYSNYVHYNQALAHPMGANLKEWVNIVRYQPTPKLNLQFNYVSTYFGKDSDSLNWGGNILKNYNEKIQDDNNKIGQGLSTTQHFIEARASYQIAHNLFLDASYQQRSQKNKEKNSKQSYPSLTFRWNMPYKSVAL